MLLARGFFVISVLAVISSASASLITPAPAAGTAPEQPQHQPYYGPSQFA